MRLSPLVSIQPQTYAVLPHCRQLGIGLGAGMGGDAKPRADSSWATARRRPLDSLGTRTNQHK
jgi:hypothetical protein